MSQHYTCGWLVCIQMNTHTYKKQTTNEYIHNICLTYSGIALQNFAENMHNIVIIYPAKNYNSKC